MSRKVLSSSATAGAAILIAIGAVLVSQGGASLVGLAAQRGPCPSGYELTDATELAREMRGRNQTPANWLAQAEDRLRLAASPAKPMCISVKHPEALAELETLVAEWDAKRSAPLGTVPPGAGGSGLAQRAVLAKADARGAVSGTGGRWSPYGKGPLIVNAESYDSVNGLGFVHVSGRVDSLDFDPVGKRLFAVIGTGGVWMSADLGKTWRSIGDNLPTQIQGALAWTPSDGGTLVVVGGEPLNGANTYTGYGGFRTNDLGRTWTQAAGIPDNALGYQVAVDPTNPKLVYAATSRGLYRSADAGRTFSNVRLPTGECAGKTDVQRCMFANWVTDVVVQSPDGFGNKGGAVLAAVGFRHGPKNFVDTEIPMAPWNGLYRSDSGAPGTFAKLEATGFAPQYRIGRTELGIAAGPLQNHDYVYAIVQDAELLNGGILPIDAPEDAEGIPFNTNLNGVYVSSDLGDTWDVMGNTATISENPTTGSALAVAGQAQLFAPGVQSWYNMWVKPDPTRQTDAGIPTRLAFGLEEVWQNEFTTEAQDGLSPFKVIGRYYSGESCLLLPASLPACPTSRGIVQTTTTHPDQHDAIWIPDGKGGVTLVVGHDGGVNTQHVDAGGELDNDHWGDGANDGFNTLLPYHASMAKDGTVWFGLQDNGQAKIDPKTRQQYMTFGGDAFFTAVDPDNSDIAYEEYVYGDMRVTTDGGKTWRCMVTPTASSATAFFSNPFVMDPTDANHLMTAARAVYETLDGPNTSVAQIPVVEVQPDPHTCLTTWVPVFDLGNTDAPGVAPDPAAEQLGTANKGTALDLQGDAAYIAYCGPCNLLNQTEVFARGLATNVGGSKPPKKGTSDGWHLAAAKGLPNRYVTGIEIDPANPKTVYVTLGGYENRQWVPPGSFGDKNKNIGRGHVYRSTDAGETFVDISGKLPNVPMYSIVKRGSQLIVGTDAGVFISSDLKGSKWAVLGEGLPVTPIVSLQVAPQDPNLLMVASYGRGIYTYTFPAGSKVAKPSVRGSKSSRGRQLPATGVATRSAGAFLLLCGAALLGVTIRRTRIRDRMVRP